MSVILEQIPVLLGFTITKQQSGSPCFEPYCLFVCVCFHRSDITAYIKITQFLNKNLKYFKGHTINII